MSDYSTCCWLCVHRWAKEIGSFVELPLFEYHCTATKRTVLCEKRNADGQCKYFKRKQHYDPSGS